MLYNFDVNRWIVSMIPAIMRKKALYALLKALLYPLQFICLAFETLRNSTLLKLSYNAFAVYLEKFLNDLLKTEGIVIEDYVLEMTLYLSHKEENYPVDYISLKAEKLPSVYVSNDNRLVGGFYVKVPETVATPEVIATIRKWVEFYKYAGTRYEIIIY